MDSYRTGLRFALPAFVAAALTGCAGHLEDYDTTKLKEQEYTVEPNASSECISAAKRATHFCVGRKSMFDADSHAECNDARWDYHRYCR